MTDKNNVPLISFAVFAYNQERFIHEAILGAFAQTYCPLEIILSDDCSDDRTFEIIKEMAGEYSGPHKIVLNRNDKNCGLGAHVNKVFDLASGELVVMAAGDDISEFNRVDVIVRHWIAYEKPSAIQHRVKLVDAEGREMSDDFLPHKVPQGSFLSVFDSEIWAQLLAPQNSITGCGLSFTKAVLQFFGPLDSSLVGEDIPLAFRSTLLDGILFIPDVLVKWRQHDTNLFNRINKTANLDTIEQIRNHKAQYRQKELRFLDHRNSIYRHIETLRQVNSRHTRNLLDFIEAKVRLFHVLSNWWETPIGKRILLFIFMVIPYGNKRERIWSLRRLLPLQVFLSRHSSN